MEVVKIMPKIGGDLVKAKTLMLCFDIISDI